MKLLSNHTDKFNELVFEHRNKSYGAYVIRKNYSSAVIKSCIITFSAVALLLGSAVVANNLNVKPVLAEIPKSDTDVIWDTVPMTLNEPLTKEPKADPDPPVQTPPSAAPDAGLNLQVTNDPVVTHSVDPEHPTDGQGDPDAHGASLTSTLTTTNTVTVETNTITIKKGVDTVVIAQDMPEYEGGLKALVNFLGSNIVYPEVAKTVGKEGTVYISFIVDENGYVNGAKVVRGIGYGCDEEALRVVNRIPKWKKPGKNNGQPVRVRFNLPISFKLK